MQKLLNHSKCAALISTHFHNLVEEIPPALATPMHMSAIVDEAAASVTFLYKLVQGCRCDTAIHSKIYFALMPHAAANLLVFTVPQLRGCPSQSSQVWRRVHVCPLVSLTRLRFCLQGRGLSCSSCRAARFAGH